MRSSKSRSRSKGNRNRSVGNVINRVFDSSGPEGKVRGTPQQIIDKYNQLARDAYLSNDRVSFENFQQHSEHYTRMLSEAQKEMEARREQQERDQRQRQQPRDDRQQDQRSDGQKRDEKPASDEQPAVAEDSGLVPTPENQPQAPKPKSRRKPKVDAAEAEQPVVPDSTGSTEAAE